MLTTNIHGDIIPYIYLIFKNLINIKIYCMALTTNTV